jgi:chemotaxis protein MotB
MAEKIATIIVIKRKASHGGHHGGAWKVAYADFVTAMMALFIVLWLLNSNEQVKKAVGGYFQDPTGSGKLMGTSMPGSGGTGTSVDVNQDNMSKLKEILESAVKEMPNFQQLKNQVEVIVTGEGLRIELLETDRGMFFESGRAEPTESGRALLQTLASQLGKMSNKLLVEGHTDAKPFPGGAAYTNWELSTERANAARRLMQEHGVRADQISQVRGFADQHLRNPKDAHAASNRRISLLVEYLQRPSPPAVAVETAKPEKSGTAPHH